MYNVILNFKYLSIRDLKYFYFYFLSHSADKTLLKILQYTSVVRQVLS